MGENPDIAAVGAYMQPIDDHGKPSGNVMTYPVRAADCSSSLRMGFAAPIGNPSAMIRKSAAISIGAYRPLFRQAADFDFWLRLVEVNRIANLPEVLVGYRIHTGSSTQSGRFTQLLNAIFARVAADARRAGREDPLTNLDSISIRTLSQLQIEAVSMQQHYEVLYDLASRGKSLLEAINCLKFSRDLANSTPAL